MKTCYRKVPTRYAWQCKTTAVAAAKPKVVARPLNREAYVVPRKLHAYNLASARELTRQPVWVQEGYRYTYYPYDSARRRADFVHAAGLLGPIEEMRITSVVAQPTPTSPTITRLLRFSDRSDSSTTAFMCIPELSGTASNSGKFRSPFLCRSRPAAGRSPSPCRFPVCSNLQQNAYPDTPILKQAKAEYAKLK